MRASEIWSVRLLLDENARNAMARFDSWPTHPAVRQMIVGGYGNHDEIDNAPFLAVELWAAGPDQAEELAQSLLDFACRDAGVGPQKSAVVWVAPARDEEESSHRFLEQAKELFDAESYELAIVAAQVHFELQMRLLMERASKRKDAAWARRLTKNPRVSMLSNDVSTAAAELLLDIDVTQNSLWPEYKEHLARRNAVVHEGRTMDRQAALASLKVVRELWAELAKVERPASLF